MSTAICLACGMTFTRKRPGRLCERCRDTEPAK